MSDIDNRDEKVRRIEIADVETEQEQAPADAATPEQDQNAVDAAELGRLQQELEDLRDRSLRTLADYENYRKRVERERTESRRYAGFEVLRELLEVVDNLERAVAAPGSVDELKQGVELILKQLHDLLRRSGVRPVPAVGEPFDPNMHEAVSRDQDATVDRPMVTAEHQPGFWMHERLLRPAVVSVAMPADKPAAGPEPEES